jgi:2-oxoglutarate/2-oxoacid ferredoxin oxidoreductase subunit alpha
MKKEISLRLSGEAGQGVETLGLILCRALKKSGYHFFAVQDYMSRIRGGNNFLQFRISASPVSASRDRVDILVALDEASVGLHAAAVGGTGLIIGDEPADGGPGTGGKSPETRIRRVPFRGIAKEKGGAGLYSNTVAFGVIAALLGLPRTVVDECLRHAFAGKPVEVIGANLAAAAGGFDFAAKNIPKSIAVLAPVRLKDQFFINGSEAIALGALAAGVQFYTAYPMTPSTGVLNTLAVYARRLDVVVEQAEDEIAAINLAIGASAAGARAMTGSSGGGFALMTEGVSLAGMTETPVVIVVAMRPGPATGFPTRTEQGDLNFVIHAGHGEFARAVFTPGTVSEAYACTVKAFELAARFQIPTFILTDQYLADSLVNTPLWKTEPLKLPEDVITREEGARLTEYKRYSLAHGAVSPRAVPGWLAGVSYIDSDEHTEEGHIAEDAASRVKMVQKRFTRKMKALEALALAPVVHAGKKARTWFIGFGSTAPVLKEAWELLDDGRVGVIHLPQVWPLPVKKIMTFLGNARAIHTVEQNAGAQLAGILRRELGIATADPVLKFDGRPFSLDEMLKALKKRI